MVLLVLPTLVVVVVVDVLTLLVEEAMVVPESFSLPILHKIAK
jgi:hypothetical protein